MRFSTVVLLLALNACQAVPPPRTIDQDLLGTLRLGSVLERCEAVKRIGELGLTSATAELLELIVGANGFETPTEAISDAMLEIRYEVSEFINSSDSYKYYTMEVIPGCRKEGERWEIARQLTPGVSPDEMESLLVSLLQGSTSEIESLRYKKGSLYVRGNHSAHRGIDEILGALYRLHNHDTPDVMEARYTFKLWGERARPFLEKIAADHGRSLRLRAAAARQVQLLSESERSAGR